MRASGIPPQTREASVERSTNETSISVRWTIDGQGVSDIETPIGFLSHMVDQLARHGRFDIRVRATGDTHIDGHHTTEDLGLCLGQAFRQALGEKKGIARYGWATLPMDEACVTSTLDLSGRCFFVWRVDMPKAKLGDFDTELAEVFFEAFARGAGCDLHVRCHEGRNLHHIIELCFKATAKALQQAVTVVAGSDEVPSTKGALCD